MFYVGCFVALLKRQGLNVKGLLKTAPAKEEPQPHIDCTGNLQVLAKEIESLLKLYGYQNEPLELEKIKVLEIYTILGNTTEHVNGI